MEIDFPTKLISFIMCCITSVQRNVLWNGSWFEFCSFQRGIRQGDPMSRYIFVMCMDKLSHLISQAIDEGDWKTLRREEMGLLCRI